LESLITKGGYGQVRQRKKKLFYNSWYHMDSSKQIQNIAHDDEQQKILSRTAEKNNDL
jgi:hypothetical protein